VNVEGAGYPPAVFTSCRRISSDPLAKVGHVLQPSKAEFRKVEAVARHLVNSPKPALNAFARVLKPGGAIVATTGMQ
jgi:hypothetical protein